MEEHMSAQEEFPKSAAELEADMQAEEAAENYELQMEIEAEEDAQPRKEIKREHRCFSIDDIGNAERFAHVVNGKVRFNHDTKQWHVWNGKAWISESGESAVWNVAVNTLKRVKEDADGVDDPDFAKRILSAAKKHKNTHKIQSMLKIASHFPGIQCTSKHFDRHPHLFCVENGTLNLNTWMLQPHNPKDMISHVAPVEYDSWMGHSTDSDRTNLEEWIDWVTCGDKEYAAFLARAVGYSLLGGNPDQVLFFVYGPTATGKSTFMTSIKKLFGDHALTVDFKSFLKSSNPNDTRRSDVAQMVGKKLVCSLEVAEGSTMAEDMIKMITGGDEIRGRYLYGEAFSYQAEFVLWLVANDAPKLREEDEAMWRRIIRLPFDAKIPATGIDPRVKHIMNNMRIMGSSWLWWAINGLKDYREQGLNPPKAVRASTEAYKREQSPLRGFISDCTSLTTKGKTPVSIVRAAYDRWCTDNGVSPKYRLGAKRFNVQMEKLGVVRRRLLYSGASLWCWEGLTLQK